MFGFSYYLLLPLVRGTNGNGYSSSAPLLPTPLASDTGNVGKGLDIQISANGSYRKMNKDGKAWTARLSHVIYRMTPTTLEKPYLNPDWVEWLMGFPGAWETAEPMMNTRFRSCHAPTAAAGNTKTRTS